MTSYVKYITKEGDRWDSISFAAYGDAFAYADIISANPHVSISSELPGGITLFIPVKSDTMVDKTLLPPWKR
jgi:nucleoid-associated protein YgaU